MTAKNLSERDKKHLWHPLTQHKLHPEMLGIVKAKGALLFYESGEEYKCEDCKTEFPTKD